MIVLRRRSRLVVILAAMCVCLILARPGRAQYLLVASTGAGTVDRFHSDTGSPAGPFVGPGSGLTGSHGLAMGSDHNLYVASGTNQIKRFNGQTGAFIDNFVDTTAGLDNPTGLAFGPDGDLFVASAGNGAIRRFNGTTGALVATINVIGPAVPIGITLGPDNLLYVCISQANAVRLLDPRTNAFIGDFTKGGGLSEPQEAVFGPDGALYVSNFAADEIKRYDGKTGAFLGTFVTGGGLHQPYGLAFGPDRSLYVSSYATNAIRKYDGKTGAFVSDFAAVSNPAHMIFLPKPLFDKGANGASATENRPLPSAVALKSGASKRIAAVLQPMVDRHALAGVVAMAGDKDHVLDVQSLGWEDITAGKKIHPNDIFWIASQSKAMTAAALMILVDEGKLTPDDRVEKYLPDFNLLWVKTDDGPNRAVLTRARHAITVREILSHTSGMPFSSLLEQPTLDGLPLRVAVGSYAMTPLQSQPGTKYSYSNAGINTAGRLIEVVSGMPYETFLQKRLFDPLGMKDTTFWPTKKQQLRLAKSYHPNTSGNSLEENPIGQLRYPLEDHTRYPMPAGGLFSTAADVMRFCRMLLNKGMAGGQRILSEEAVRQMTIKQTGSEVTDAYGLGLAIGQGTFQHGGAYATQMEVDTNKGLIYVWMVQHAGFLYDGAEGFGNYKKAVNAELAK